MDLFLSKRQNLRQETRYGLHRRKVGDQRSSKSRITKRAMRGNSSTNSREWMAQFTGAVIGFNKLSLANVDWGNSCRRMSAYGHRRSLALQAGGLHEPSLMSFVVDNGWLVSRCSRINVRYKYYFIMNSPSSPDSQTFSDLEKGLPNDAHWRNKSGSTVGTFYSSTKNSLQRWSANLPRWSTSSDLARQSSVRKCKAWF